jgi:hypothetical protein
MFTQSQFQLSQNRELAPRIELAGAYELIYTFSRSAKRQTRDYPGADYLSFAYNDSQLVFSVCDGVSGAFAGYIAAKFIGDRLINWSKNQEKIFESTTTLEKKLSEVLQIWTKDGTELVNSTPLLLNGDETDRDFMERRRKKGSQTMFLLGILDIKQNKAFFVGLGDIRMFIKYNNKSEPNFIVGQKKNVWSTLNGQIGNLWSRSFKLSDVNRFTIYTDGFEQFSNNPISVQTKNELSSIALPEDDVTVFSVQPNFEPMSLHQAQVPKFQIKDGYIIFDNVKDDEWIRVFVENDVLEVVDSKIFLNEDFKSAGKGKLRYQVVGEKVQPSAITLLKLLDDDSQQQEIKLPPYIKDRKRPVINKPVISDPRKPALPPIYAPVAKNTESKSQSQNIIWLRYFGVLGWVLALISWGITAYFFLQIGKQKEEIQELSQQVETQQALLNEYKTLPTATPAFTITPTFTETSIPVNILFECVTQEDGLHVFKVPDIASSPVYIMPAGHKFVVLQTSEDQSSQEWFFISDLEVSFDGWLKTQDLDLTENCIAKQ